MKKGTRVVDFVDDSSMTVADAKDSRWDYWDTMFVVVGGVPDLSCCS